MNTSDSVANTSPLRNPRHGASPALQEVPTRMSAGGVAAMRSDYVDSNPVPTFVIDAGHVVTHWNRACEHILECKAADMLGTSGHRQIPGLDAPAMLADLIVDGRAEELFGADFHGKFRRSTVIPGAIETEELMTNSSGTARWLCFSAAPMRDQAGRVVGAVEVIQDVTQRKLAEGRLDRIREDLQTLVSQKSEELEQTRLALQQDIVRRDADLDRLNTRLNLAQEQLEQSEKLASIGQLAAGVAHEINNPIGYVFSNFNSLQGYIEDLFTVLSAYEKAETHVSDPQVRAALAAVREKVDLAFLKEDIPVLMRESGEGIVRVRKIVEDLKDFSRRQSGQEWQLADLHQGIESTLNIVSNEVKYKADIVKDYGEIPDIECIPSEINQVVMNMVVNASHAIGEGRGIITIRTRTLGDHVLLEIEDNGCGMSKEVQARIFTPFFTTKPIGKGTGLGLSVSYGIVQRHNGSIELDSELGAGTRFRILLPIHHAATDEGGQNEPR